MWSQVCYNNIKYKEVKKMPKDTYIKARIDSTIKEEGNAILATLGLTATDAVNMLYRLVILNKGLPFDVKIPNVETLEVMKDIQEGKNIETFESLDSMFKELNS